MDEARFYNALAVAFAGDRFKLEKIFRKFGDWGKAYAVLKNDYFANTLFAGALPAEDPASIKIPDAEKEWDMLLKSGVKFFLAGESQYPQILAETKNPPIGLYIRGSMPWQDASVGADFTGASCSSYNRCIAAVGTRRATPQGTALMEHFAATLAENGFIIVSGLAFGIDASAHIGCLNARGTTIAVLAGGLHGIYPRENAKLADRILGGGGALISEYPLGTPPFASRFLERNRIIAGLSKGVLIIEAPMKSGALVTARLGMEENRDVFAVPGPVTHRNYEGSHALIRQGAELVTSPEEILEAYGISKEAAQNNAILGSTYEEKQILEALRAAGAPLDVDKISVAAKLEPRIANRLLAFLLARNIIKESGGGYTI